MSNGALVFDEVVTDVAAVEIYVAARGLKQPDQHVDCGGLARTIGAEIAQHLARPDGKAHAFDSRNAGVVFGEVPDFEHIGRSASVGC